MELVVHLCTLKKNFLKMENIIVQEKENNSLSITNSDHESDISPVYSPVSQEKAQQVSTNNKRKSLAKTKESTSQNDSASENGRFSRELDSCFLISHSVADSHY